MKVSMLALIALLNTSVFAAEYKGFTLTGLPTASRNYDYTSYDSSKNIEETIKVLEKECLKDKAEAENLAKSNGYKIISSKGCKISGQESGGDMSPWMAKYSGSFEVIFLK